MRERIIEVKMLSPQAVCIEDIPDLEEPELLGDPNC